MMSRGSLGYAHARIRAWKSHLLTRSDAAPLLAASDAATVDRAAATLDTADPLRRMTMIYNVALRGYAHGRPLLRALLQRHEIENVKLLWRVAANHLPHDVVPSFWLDLRPVAAVPMLECSSTGELAERLSYTPYARIATTVLRAHGDDLGAAELSLDRWVSQCLEQEKSRLPRDERVTRRLVDLILRERQSELGRRGTKWFGLTNVPANIEEVTALRHARLRLCRRAFVGSPFLLAPAVAVILLAEEEVRALRALVERRGEAALDAPMLRALAGSQLAAATGAW